MLSLCQTRFFTVSVRQRIRQRGRLLQYKQTHYTPKPNGYTPLPVGLLGNGYLRRLLKANTAKALELVSQVEWSSFQCDVSGVRFHPSGSWRVTFKRSNMHTNFFVNCSCYFRTSQHGFFEAKKLAIAYRRRLEWEWENLETFWNSKRKIAT
jgi:AP2 domain